MNILFVYSSSTGCRYLKEVLYNHKQIPIETYTTFDDSEFDCLIYNSFPGENHPTKFNKSIVFKADEKFFKFKGKKILFDSTDDGNSDAFTRFNDPTLPRIKVSPSFEFYKKFNIILAIPFLVHSNFIATKKYEKNIPLLYAVRVEGYYHNIRKDVFDKIKKFNPYIKRHPFEEYLEILKHSKISISVPGYGPVCYSHLETLASNTMLLAHESIKKFDVLPTYDLIDGYHYISFNLNNLDDILFDFLNNPIKVNEIINNGHNFFINNYSIQKSYENLINYLK